MPATDSWMVIGRVAGPFGVRGEIKIEPFTDFPERFARLKQAHLGPEHRVLLVERSRRHRGIILLKVEGIDSPEQVDDLRGLELAVPRNDAVALPEGHYFLDDLPGMSVMTVDGEPLGTITDVLRTGSNDVFVVNDGRKEVLIPAIKDAVTELDFDRRRVVVEQWVLEDAE